MAGVIQKIFLTSMFMWMTPLVILYGFNAIPGFSSLSSSQQTIYSGIFAVISVNLVIGFYIYLAMKEPSGQQHQPDPRFLAEAKASISQSAARKVEDSDQVPNKED